MGYEKGLPTPEKLDVLLNAIITYGMEAQTDMVIEEMAELTWALLKDRRQRNFAQGSKTQTMQNVIEETADVIIMLNQLLMMLDMDGIDAYSAVSAAIKEKVDRQEKRLACAHTDVTQGYAGDILSLTT